MLPLFSSWREAVWLGGWGRGGGFCAAPAGPQGGQSQGGSQGQAKQFAVDVLFHFSHLLKNSTCFMLSDFRLRSCCCRTGVCEIFFIFFWLTPGEYGGRFS